MLLRRLARSPRGAAAGRRYLSAIDDVLVKSPPFLKNVTRPLPSLGDIEISTQIHHTDANLAGNCHGGTILSLLEHAGYIAAAKHCNILKNVRLSPTSTGEEASVEVVVNHDNDEAPRASPVIIPHIVRLERVDFKAPVFVGDIAKIQSKVIYTSEHSLLLAMHVWAENYMTGELRLTNRAFVWYAATKHIDYPAYLRSNAYRSMGEIQTGRAMQIDLETIGIGHTLAKVPLHVPKTHDEIDLFAFGTAYYTALKKQRSRETRRGAAGRDAGLSPSELASTTYPQVLPSGPRCISRPAKPRDASRCEFSELVLPNNCGISTRYSTGGFLMKLMDNCAGTVAFRHCGTNIVTAAVDALDFLNPVPVGSVVRVAGVITHASHRSIEVEVHAECELYDSLHGSAAGAQPIPSTAQIMPEEEPACPPRAPAVSINGTRTVVCCSAHFTMVSLNQKGRPIASPPLLVQGPADMEAYRAGERRYADRKSFRI